MQTLPKRNSWGAAGDIPHAKWGSQKKKKKKKEKKKRYEITHHTAPEARIILFKNVYVVFPLWLSGNKPN